MRRWLHSTTAADLRRIRTALIWVPRSSRQRLGTCCDRCRRLKHPRTFYVVGNVHDEASGHIETDEREWGRLGKIIAQDDDHRFAIDFAERHAPRHDRTFVFDEVRRTGETSGETIGDTQARIG